MFGVYVANLKKKLDLKNDSNNAKPEFNRANLKFSIIFTTRTVKEL